MQKPLIIVSSRTGNTRILAHAAADALRERFTEDDTRIGVIQAYLDGVASDGRRGAAARVCVREIIDHALQLDRDGGNPPRKLVNEIHVIMANRIDGWMAYPANKDAKARCGSYGVQRCYVPRGSMECVGGVWMEAE